MTPHITLTYTLSALLLACFGSISAQTSYDVLIIGGGTSGTSAAIQAARSGSRVLLVEEGVWLGGMLSSAGVSAIDGNHQLASGLWGEFRSKIYAHYGGPEAVSTGWVSHTLFEPSVADSILKAMANHPNLEIWYQSRVTEVVQSEVSWQVTIQNHSSNNAEVVESYLLVDATEYGDILAEVGVPYDLGMDDPTNAEPWAPGKNDIIQDLTWVAVLKEFENGNEHLIEQPEGYDAREFACACKNQLNPDGMDPVQMLNYAKLPNNKYILNWPNCGNDAYINVIEATQEDRAQKLEQAKLQTLRFVYFIQNELGFTNLGLAKDEFPSGTGLALMPYHRESRRAQNIVRLNVQDLAEPFQPDRPLYRTAIAVGDYPIDHHHKKNSDAPNIEFIDIKVPSYSVPIGSLIPENTDRFIVAEKSISVTNIVNGTTRLQPVVMGIGQAVGVLASLSANERKNPKEISIRTVQEQLIDSGASIMPYMDVPNTDPDFASIQRVGAMGWLRGRGVPYKWANQTWFYPEDLCKKDLLLANMNEQFPSIIDKVNADGAPVTLEWLIELMNQINSEVDKNKVMKWLEVDHKINLSNEYGLNRRWVSRILDHFLVPFNYPVNHRGHFINIKTKQSY